MINRVKLPITAILLLVLTFISTVLFGQRSLISSRTTPEGIELTVSDGTIKISAFKTESFEVLFEPENMTPFPSYAIAPDAMKTKVIINDEPKQITVQNGQLKAIIEKAPFRISYLYENKEILSEEKGYFHAPDTSGFRFNLQQEEKLMGGGMRVLGMDRRGLRLQLYNRASYGFETHSELMYYSLPVVVSSNKYILAFDNGASGFLDLGKEEQDILQFEAVGGRWSYLITASSTWQGLTKNFTELTGRQGMVPRWALGNIASRMGYHTQDEVKMVVDEYQKQNIPLDGIVIDLFWFGPDIKGHMGNLDWDYKAFPNPGQMFKYNREKGVKTLLITEPFILTTSSKFNEVVEKKLVGTTIEGKPFIYDFYFGSTTLLDIFKSEVKDWFWDIYKKHTLTGVDGWWGDLGEPEVHPSSLQHINGSADQVHNIYGHVWAQTVYEGYKKDFPDKRPVILMRSGFIGSQRYNMLPWTGDVNRTWGGFKPQVELSLQMGLQGLAYMSSDLGGFAGDYKDAELYTRWLQYGVFQPVYRTHAQESVPAEPIFWDTTTRNIVRDYIKLRYALTPYNYTAVWENATAGTPLMRPLFFVEDNNNLISNNKEYLWGDAFLVSPVTTKGASKQTLYLPNGHKWYNFWTDEVVNGGDSTIASFTINTFPIFVKAGSFIPMAPIRQTLDAYNTDRLTLHYYPGEENTLYNGIIYDDDGFTQDAWKSKNAEIIRLKANEGKTTLLSISSDNGSFIGKPLIREITWIIHNITKKPEKITLNGTPIEIINQPNPIDYSSLSNKLTEIEYFKNSKSIKPTKGKGTATKQQAVWDPNGNKLYILSTFNGKPQTLKIKK